MQGSSVSGFRDLLRGHEAVYEFASVAVSSDRERHWSLFGFNLVLFLNPSSSPEPDVEDTASLEVS